MLPRAFGFPFLAPICVLRLPAQIPVDSSASKLASDSSSSCSKDVLESNVSGLHFMRHHRHHPDLNVTNFRIS